LQKYLKNKIMTHHIKFIARFKVETNTPLGIGAGRSGLLNTRLVARDANGLPYIPGSSLAGIVRHELEQDNTLKSQVNQLFGFQENQTGQGSRIVFSTGQLVADNDKDVLDGLQNISFDSEYYSNFKMLPERDHVRINHKGTADKRGKFEEEIVFKGTRFVFEIEMQGTEADQPIWHQILHILNQPSFRIGAGTRKGFGQLKIINCQTRAFNLNNAVDLIDYLNKSSSLNVPLEKSEEFKDRTTQNTSWVHYQIKLKAENFFLFGSGLRNEGADNTPKREKFFEWENAAPRLKDNFLIPASSLKGAIAHRVAYHYNNKTRSGQTWKFGLAKKR
jgi:CRISPR/Cas system CSM-associated protein Csm3 (group 7 of RAMP superfamily)